MPKRKNIKEPKGQPAKRARLCNDPICILSSSSDDDDGYFFTEVFAHNEFRNTKCGTIFGTPLNELSARKQGKRGATPRRNTFSKSAPAKKTPAKRKVVSKVVPAPRVAVSQRNNRKINRIKPKAVAKNYAQSSKPKRNNCTPPRQARNRASHRGVDNVTDAVINLSTSCVLPPVRHNESNPSKSSKSLQKMKNVRSSKKTIKNKVSSVSRKQSHNQRGKGKKKKTSEVHCEISESTSGFQSVDEIVKAAAEFKELVLNDTNNNEGFAENVKLCEEPLPTVSEQLLEQQPVEQQLDQQSDQQSEQQTEQQSDLKLDQQSEQQPVWVKLLSELCPPQIERKTEVNQKNSFERDQQQIGQQQLDHEHLIDRQQHDQSQFFQPLIQYPQIENLNNQAQHEHRLFEDNMSTEAAQGSDSESTGSTGHPKIRVPDIESIEPREINDSTDTEYIVEPLAQELQRDINELYGFSLISTNATSPSVDPIQVGPVDHMAGGDGFHVHIQNAIHLVLHTTNQQANFFRNENVAEVAAVEVEVETDVGDFN